MMFLSSPERNKDPRNHCIRFFETFCDDEDEGFEYIVMPVMNDFDLPKFYAVGEVVDFVRQTLEVSTFLYDTVKVHQLTEFKGLLYMHEQGCAHW